jgi:hypothetical protein
MTEICQSLPQLRQKTPRDELAIALTDLPRERDHGADAANRTIRPGRQGLPLLDMKYANKHTA